MIFVVAAAMGPGLVLCACAMARVDASQRTNAASAQAVVERQVDEFCKSCRSHEATV